MSTFLYKLGKTAYSKPWHFIVSWILILAIVLAILGVNGIHVTSDMKIEGTESQKVLDQLTQELPEASGGQASIVFTAPEGESLDTTERLSSISEAVNKVYNLEYVINPIELAAQAAQAGASMNDAAQAAQAGASMNDAAQTDQAAQQGNSAEATQGFVGELPPYGPMMIDGVPVPGVMIANDGSIALFQFQFTVQQMSLPESVPDLVMDAAMAVEQTGISALPSDSLSTKPAIGSTEAIGLVVAAVVLFMTLGSVVAAGLPLLTALMGVGISVGGAYAFSKMFHMTDLTPVLALMVGLAVGIDYSLFIVNRQRRMILEQGLSAREALSRAVGTAGSAVFFAGLTVIIALCGMVVIGIGFLSAMALVAAVAVLINVLVALTLLPALLGLVGERICSAKARAKNNNQTSKNPNGFAHRWVTAVVKGRWAIVLVVIVILGIAAIPAAKMEMGIPSGATANLDTTARQSYDAISNGFGEGFNGPFY